jgi:hypothetical protein
VSTARRVPEILEIKLSRNINYRLGKNKKVLFIYVFIKYGAEQMWRNYFRRTDSEYLKDAIVAFNQQPELPNKPMKSA